MNKRSHNILFHTHTISGILISVFLYVIFFAGSFSFFRDQIVSWERNEPIKGSHFTDMDLNVMMDSLSERYDMYGRDIAFYRYFEERRISVNVSASRDTTASESGNRRGNFFYIDTRSLDSYSYAGNYSIGEFLYRLHFLAQLNLFGRSGYLIAGLVSFFFLFAIITGVLVHWKKIVSNFYVFRPKASLKNIWTDAHTALGIIGLPFQFVYAVTGVFLIVGTTIMSPVVLSYMYEGDSEKMNEDFGFRAKEYPLAMRKVGLQTHINAFVNEAQSRWPDFEIKGVTLYNFGDANMHIGVTGNPLFSKKITGQGEVVYHAGTGEIVFEKDPYKGTSYLDGARGIMDRLHYGDFGGVGLRVIYFILGLTSCFVILSGILIWLVARDKKTISEKKRKFNAWVGWIYLAICLSMYPVTAFTFLAVKLFLVEFDASRMSSIYHIFFYSWLVLIVLFVSKRDNYFTNKYTLILGSVLGFLVPLVNGIVSGNWIWKTFSQGHYDIFLVDVFWLVLSVTTFIIALGLKRKQSGLQSQGGRAGKGLAWIPKKGFKPMNSRLWQDMPGYLTKNLKVSSAEPISRCTR